MSNVSAHLYEYRRKARPRDPSSVVREAALAFVVRDLAWALASPHILSDDVEAHGVRVYSDEDARRALADSRAWLSSLDDDPTHLLRWVASQRGSNKLGFYFGALIEYAARFCPAIAAEAVTVHRQVAHDLGAGRMVGQLKLVAKRPNDRTRRREVERGGDEHVAREDPSDPSEPSEPSPQPSSEVLHWEFNVKYFVDGGSVDTPSRRATRETFAETFAPSDPTEPSANEPPLRAPNDDADDAAFDAAGLARPPSGDSCYVGPFLHENLHVRVAEARRKLALAGHPRVDGWLARWAAGRLEGEDTLDPSGVPIVPREEDAAVDAEGENPRGFRRPRTSEQILRGYLFYPLGGDERGGGSWARTRPRGHASANHLRGWWVTDPDDIALVPASHEDDPNDPANAFLGERIARAPVGDEDHPADDRMWAVLTRKCHWLGPCEAEYVPDDASTATAKTNTKISGDGSSSARDRPLRDGATTPWIVRGVPELGVRDVEVVPTRLVADAAREVLRASDRGVLIAELIGPFRRSTDGAAVWRERSRGFVLPPRWDPWGTMLRRDPFRRRYERGKLTAEELEDETAPEGTFEVMYPDRLDVDELGDDVRVGPRRVFRGNISWKTERDAVRDRASLVERVDAADPLDGGFDPKRRGAAGAKRADLGARFAAAASASVHPAASLLAEVRAVVAEERGLPRPARPHLVRALGRLGGFDSESSSNASTTKENLNGDAISNANLRGATPSSSSSSASARSIRLARERTETRALVSAAVRGAATCLVTLDQSAERATDEEITTPASSSVRTWAYSDRRRVAHALLDAVGPAARRNGCVGLAHVASVRAVFAGCLLARTPDAASGGANVVSPASTFHVGLACPRVAVRFANILRVPPSAAIDPGDATALAEALVRAVANADEDEVGNARGAPPFDDGFDRDFELDPGGAVSVSLLSDDAIPSLPPSAVDRSSPPSNVRAACVSRAGAVAELLSWSGESSAFPESSAEVLAVACVEAGHASAAEALARDVPSLSRRLVEAHAELGNHRAARRVAAELEWDRTDDHSDILFDLETLDVAEDVAGHADVDPEDAKDAKDPKDSRPTPLANLLADSDEGILLVDCASTLETARERARIATDGALFADEVDGESDEAPPGRMSRREALPVHAYSSAASSSLATFVGLDCEWRPGVDHAPVELVQLAFGANRARVGGARAVLLDCPALLGDAADASLAAATTRFLAEVFSRAVIVGFGVAADVERLFASYPDRFRRFPVPALLTDPALTGPVLLTDPALTGPALTVPTPTPPVDSVVSAFPDATCACARDAAVSLGVPAAATASLSSLCRAVLDGRALDKKQQKSDWARRPLTREQIAYAATDALAPAMAFHKLAEVAKKSEARRGLIRRGRGATTTEKTMEKTREGEAADEGEQNGGDDFAPDDNSDDAVVASVVANASDVVAFARAWTRRVIVSRAIERSAPPPRTVDDVHAAIERVPGLALETWTTAEDPNAEGEDEDDDGDENQEADDDEDDEGKVKDGDVRDGSSSADATARVRSRSLGASVAPPGVTLCKTLGVVATGVGSNPGAPRFVVCALRAGDDARLDMDALADAIVRSGSGDDGESRLSKSAASLPAKNQTSSVRTVRCRMATRDELAREFGFPPGSMGPFGLRPDPSAPRATFVDEDVFDGDPKKKVAVGGGAPNVKVVGDAQTLFRACDAVVARVSRRQT